MQPIEDRFEGTKTCSCDVGLTCTHGFKIFKRQPDVRACLHGRGIATVCTSGGACSWKVNITYRSSSCRHRQALTGSRDTSMAAQHPGDDSIMTSRGSMQYLQHYSPCFIQQTDRQISARMKTIHGFCYNKQFSWIIQYIPPPLYHSSQCSVWLYFFSQVKYLSCHVVYNSL